MQTWHLFQDSRFELQFTYPYRTADGESVDRLESEQAGTLRIHLLSPIGREVYFEVSKYDPLSPEAAYRQHCESLEKQFDRLEITALRKTTFAAFPAHEYSFEWDQEKRAVLLVERGTATYRLLYNSQFPINLQILSTVEWLTHS